MTDILENLKRKQLLECYYSGQISEDAWTKHLADDPELDRQYRRLEQNFKKRNLANG